LTFSLYLQSNIVDIKNNTKIEKKTILEIKKIKVMEKSVLQQNPIYMVEASQLEEFGNNIIEKAVEKLEKRSEASKVYFINQVAKILGLGHSTVKKLCKDGHIKTTTNGMITQQALDDYISGK